MKNKANIRTISEITGYSQSTISNVLNMKKGVNADTAEKIFHVATEIGYHKSSPMNNIKVVMYKKSGLILMDTPFISALLEGVESEGHIHGLSTIIHNVKEKEDGFQSKLDQISRERNSGIILLATELEWADMKVFSNIKTPFVVVDAWFREGFFDTVLMDNTDSLYVIVKYLVEMGHKKIGYIGSSVNISNFFYRKNGFINALRLFGLCVEDKYCVNLTPTSNGAYEDMLRYLKSKPKMPSAYCVVNDVVSFGVMKAINECGYHIPEDISIVGFDNMPLSEISTPPLTTVNVPKKELGQIAVQRLMTQAMNKSAVPVKTQLLTSLVFRKSVKKIR
ncbi:MAG: LacI family DNA-binding transcriptional regulator [Treponema sp.]|jgi:LacI family transcriptional regulator|nr:LacI family DNA-binding transcriptional regulator [Treponema sp.]